MDRDIEAWKGVNSDGDTVTVWRSKSGDFPISFRNDEEGYAGATVIPKEAFAKALTEAYNAGLEAAAGIAKAHGHMPPFDDTKEIDRIASYSTKTCEMIADAIRALKENP